MKGQIKGVSQGQTDTKQRDSRKSEIIETREYQRSIREVEKKVRVKVEQT